MIIVDEETRKAWEELRKKKIRIGEEENKERKESFEEKEERREGKEKEEKENFKQEV